MPHEEFLIVMTLIVSGVALVFSFAIPLRKALVRKIEGRQAMPDPQLLEEVDLLRDRVGELEERLDFTERLLSQQRDATALHPGGGR